MRSASGSERRSRPVETSCFVGRANELELLLEAIRRAGAGSGSMILVGGDAGIGKTRIVAEFRTSAGLERPAVAIGACLEYAQSPFGPFYDVMRQLGVAMPAKRASTKRQKFGDIAAALRTAGAERACVVIIEDLHWADQATLELLQYLAPALPETRLLVVVTYRTDELHRLHPVTETVAKLMRSPAVYHVTLKPFSPTEAYAFMDAVLGDREPLERPVVARIMALAEGNPLFVEELLRDAMARPSPAGAGDELPSSLRELVLERLRRLPEGDQHVLVRAASLGCAVDLDVLSGIVGRDIDEVRDVLRRARALQLIVEQRGATVSYTFRHALTQEALGSELLAEEVRALHAAAVGELEARHPARIEELAHHAWAARDVERAFEYNLAAGDRAAAMYAFADAVRLYERAIEFCAGPSARRAQTHEKIAAALFDAGWTAQAARHSEAACADYERCVDFESAAYAYHGLALQCFVACDRDACVRAIERAAELLRRVPQSARASEVLALMSRQMGRLGDLDGAWGFLEEAQRRGDVERAGTASAFFHARGLAHCMAGDPDGAVSDLRRALRDLPPDDPGPVGANLGLVAMEFGFDDVAEEFQQRALEAARRYRQPAQELFCLGLCAELDVQRGRYAAAARYLEDAETLAAAVDFPSYAFAKLTAASMRLAMRMQRPELSAYFDADRMLESSFRCGGAEFIAEMASAYVESFADDGRLDDAAALLHRAIPAVGRGISRSTLLVLAASCARADDLPAARAALADGAQAGNTLGRARLALFDARSALRGGDGAATRAKALEAAATFAGRRPYEHAQALEIAGDVTGAHALYESIGDRRDALRLRADALGVNRLGRARDELTNRERQISRLIASGKSNRAVAAELMISERTVEKHAEAILSKLGFSSRTELAARHAEPPAPAV